MEAPWSAALSAPFERAGRPAPVQERDEVGSVLARSMLALTAKRATQRHTQPLDAEADGARSRALVWSLHSESWNALGDRKHGAAVWR